MTSLARQSDNSGSLTTHVIRKSYGRITDNIIRATHPDMIKSDKFIRKYRENNWHNITRGLDKILLAAKYKIPTCYGLLYVRLLKGNGEVIDYGLVSTRVVTTVGAGYVIDAFQTSTSVELENMKFHGIGTGTNAEAVGDTALQTEVTTGLNPDNTRATGTTVEGASANIYRTVGTNTVDATLAITEHGIFSQAATGGGVLFDRSVFSAINMVTTDQLQTTYEWTLNTGG